jgi:hypothetical protein
MSSANEAHAHPGGRVEPDRIHLRGYYATMIATALIVLGSIAVVLVFFHVVERSRPQPSVAPIRAERGIPEPRLQVDPPGELQSLRAAERARLSSYGWVDQQRGVVHVPIGRAIDMLLKRGLPVRDAPQPHSEPGAP